jgi:hypothetical protein
VVKENEHLAVRWSFQTAPPRLEILENRCDRHLCTTGRPTPPLTFPGMRST